PLGPWFGGINTNSDPTAISDNELWDCINFDIDLDGSLTSRPPVALSVHSNGWTDHIVCIGYATIAGVHYIIGSNNQGTYFFDGNNWQLIKAGLQASCAVQFRDLVYIPAISIRSQSGGYWQPGSGWTPDTFMPRG